MYAAADLGSLAHGVVIGDSGTPGSAASALHQKYAE